MSPCRTVTVDDDSYLILNEGQSYGSVIRCEREVEGARVLEHAGSTGAHSPEFLERLNPHDTTVTPVLRFIRHHIRAGVDDEQWYEEQLQILATRMLAQHRRIRTQALSLQCVKTSTRIEICRRVALAVDFIHSFYDRDIGLEQMAAVACMSVHHFIRLFRQIHGVTPMAYLYRKRIRVAQRLRDSCELSMQEIAMRVGFNSRATFYRQWQQWQREPAGTLP
jgi:AraC-like DNA-binding protein